MGVLTHVRMLTLPPLDTSPGVRIRKQQACDILHELPFGLSPQCVNVEMVFLWPASVVLLGWLLSVGVGVVVVGFAFKALDPVGDGSDGIPTLCFSFCPSPHYVVSMFLPAEEVQRAALFEEDTRRRSSSMRSHLLASASSKRRVNTNVSLN